MKKEKILVCDHDLSYAEHLTDYLNRQPDFPFLVVPFTRTDALREYLQKETCRFLLLDEALLEEYGSGPDPVKVILLQEGNGEGICRYQSCTELQKQILEKSREPSGSLPEIPRECRLLGVYSPVGRCGKTIFAVTLGLILAETEPVLYWNLESYHGLGALAGKEGKYDLADLIYQFRMTGAKETGEMMESAVTDWQGLDCLNPAFTAYDLNEVLPEDWNSLFDLAGAVCGYRTIILDIGNQIREVYRLLDKCSLIFVPVLNDRISQAKIRQFEENMAVLQSVSLDERIRQVVVPRLRSDSELSGFPGQLTRGKIGSYVRSVAAAEGLLPSE